MSYFRITLYRSAIGLPKRTHGVLAALGLHRRMQTVYHPVSPDFAGMIMKVKELVRVQEVDKPLTKVEMQDLRRPDPGFYVEKAAPRPSASRTKGADAAAAVSEETPEKYAALL